MGTEKLHTKINEHSAKISQLEEKIAEITKRQDKLTETLINILTMYGEKINNNSERINSLSRRY